MVTIDDAGTATVGLHWSKRFFPYPHNRLYHVAAGSAIIHLAHSRTLTLAAGNLYLLPAFRMQRAECPKTMTHRYAHFSFTDPGMNARLIRHERLCIPSPPAVDALFSAVLTAVKRGSIEARVAGTGALLSLLAPFFAGMRDTQHSRFDPVLAYIEEHLSDDIDIPSLASIVSLDTNYFSNLFSKRFHCSPKHYIIRRRTETACGMLAHTDQRVNVIARAVGFTSDIHFSRTFRSLMHITPAEYRRRIASDRRNILS